ncbi:MAG: hypothetical protein HWN80_19800 [Candidatus Lokiarchaeota archaeon]|nr:hypothetical protein [Candidatus Lokiarchaeota archaeon]
MRIEKKDFGSCTNKRNYPNNEKSNAGEVFSHDDMLNIDTNNIKCFCSKNSIKSSPNLSKSQVNDSVNNTENEENRINTCEQKIEELINVNAEICQKSRVFMPNKIASKDHYIEDYPRIVVNNTKNKIGIISSAAITKTQEKMNKLSVIISNQLQHYSRTGKRLFSIKKASMMAGWSKMSGMKYSRIILKQNFKDPENAKLIYDMIFGTIRTSYQKTKQQLISKGLLLTTTSTQWFEMMKIRESPASKLYVEVQCLKDESHKSTVRLDSKSGCYECMILNNLPKGRGRTLNFHDVLEVASGHNLQLISFYDDSQQLTVDEFNDLLKKYQSQHQDSKDYKFGSNIHINLKWKCLDCDHIFETPYRYIQDSKVNNYCLKCVSSLDQQRTLETAEELFQDYIAQSFYSNWQLPKFLPNRILFMDKYQAISDPRVHVDCFGVIYINGKEFKIAIEHQGPQHYSFSAFLDLVQSKDVARGIYKTAEEYKSMFDAQIERDLAKVELFKDLNKDGYYLIVVPYFISPNKRSPFILDEFVRQTGVISSQPGITDYL